MISWAEKAPDFVRHPLEALLADMSVVPAFTVCLGAGRAIRVVTKQGLLDAIESHLRERSVEMGGLLVGAVHQCFERDDERFVVSVANFVRAQSFDGTSASLRMDTTVWEAARGLMSKGQFVIGWYHSHPNLGAFFSGTDRSTQRAFFSAPHSLGLVVDPIRKEERWFQGADSVPLPPTAILKL